MFRDDPQPGRAIFNANEVMFGINSHVDANDIEMGNMMIFSWVVSFQKMLEEIQPEDSRAAIIRRLANVFKWLNQSQLPQAVIIMGGVQMKRIIDSDPTIAAVYENEEYVRFMGEYGRIIGGLDEAPESMG